MSFDAYVNHISQKYRLAVAIAIIRSKPDNKTTEDYIKELKQKVIDQNMDSNDLDITICSDDFNLDDDNDITTIHVSNDTNSDNDGNIIIVDENDVLMDDTRMTNDSITILNDFDDINDVIGQKNSDNVKIKEFSDVFRMLTDVEENLQEQHINTYNPNDQIQTDSQTTYCDVDLIDNDATYKSIDFDNTQKRSDYIDKTINQDMGRNGTESYLAEGTVPNNNVGNDMIRAKSNKTQDLDMRDSKVKVNTMDSQETVIYTLHGLTQNYTHVSQSQKENLIIPDKYIHGIGKMNRNEVTNFKTNTTENKDTTNHIEIFTENAQRFDASLNTQEFTNANDCNEIANVLENEQVIEEERDTEAELLPFKVIEELSKVKGFLDRKFDRRTSTNSFSTDSGYKSDSQLKSSCKSATQLSGTWVNQSAYSLFNFITICPLLVNTRDIINEISKALGELIDRLHEEEKYPSFLEELLEAVDLLLRRIYEDGGSENELLKKDESIQRLILLSKSINIQKFLIEKITNILDEAYTNLIKDDDQFEIIHINKIENLSYIFHLLEIILKAYVKCKDLSSQNSLTSQEEKLKRSSITDIWRRKWNPNYKEIRVNEGSVEKKCVLVKCSEVLNKIIVNCMECYSLVAYAALQSFNLLQS